jgi:hypothetical protein
MTMSGKMFAVVNDDEKTPVFVKFGVVGFWDVPETRLFAWAQMHAAQGAALTASATAGALFGWDVPGAQLAALSAIDPVARA